MALRRIGNFVWLAAGLAVMASAWGCSGTGAQSELPGFLQELLPPSPSKVARDAFNVYDPDTRRRAVNLLSTADWGDEAPYLRTYRLLIDDPDPTVRAACLSALARHGEVEDVTLILPNLQHDDPLVRWEAAKALQRLHREDAVDPLIRRLVNDESVDVRMAAANALAQYHHRRVFDALIGALNDENYGVVREAQRSLATMTGQELGDRGSAWLSWAETTNNLFADAQPYHYPQFVRPPGVLDKMQFWKGPPTVEPKAPRGLQTSADADDANTPAS
jgi:hypothetical protein